MQSIQGVSGVKGSVKLKVIHTTVMTKVVRSSVHNRSGTNQIQSVASNVAQPSVRGPSAMVAIMHNVDTDLTSNNAIQDSAPEVVGLDPIISGKEVSNDQNDTLSKQHRVISSLLLRDLSLNLLLKGVEEFTIPIVKVLIISDRSNHVFLGRALLKHAQSVV